MGDDDSVCDQCGGSFIKRTIEEHRIVITMDKVTEKIFTLDGEFKHFCSKRCQEAHNDKTFH